jgi:hypothetical protein
MTFYQLLFLLQIQKKSFRIVFVMLQLLVVLLLFVTFNNTTVSSQTIFNGRVRINCGSVTDTIDNNGIVWLADQYYINGRSYTPPLLPITTIPLVQQTNRTTTKSTGTTNSLTTWIQQQQKQNQLTNNNTNNKKSLRRQLNDPVILQQQRRQQQQQSLSIIHKSCRTGTKFLYSIPVYANRRVQYRITLHFYELM